MRINDEGVSEVHLAADNTPAFGQVLSYTGGTQDFTWVAAGVGAGLYYVIPDADVGGTANAITLTTGS